MYKGINSDFFRKTLSITVLLVINLVGVKAQEGFQKKVFHSSKQDSLLYNILCPQKNIDKESQLEKYPLILFLHGSGERGDDNKIQVMHISELFLNQENRKEYPAFVIAPQCPKNKRWVEVKWDLDKHTMTQNPSESMQLTMDLIDSLIQKYPIDPQRIYITGLSMGGFGTWDAIARYPDKFAAAVPICGGGDENTAKSIADIQIWAFHGADDKVVKVERSRNMIEAIRKEGGSPKYTEYKGVGHGSWIPAYKEKGLLKWLFIQSLKQKDK
ncbi:MAG: prolyl oligopeptidase family serine peptidase [Bacteroidota bacterium]